MALDDSSSRRYIGERTKNIIEASHDPCRLGLPKDAWWLCCLAFENKSDAIQRGLVGNTSLILACKRLGLISGLAPTKNKPNSTVLTLTT